MDRMCSDHLTGDLGQLTDLRGVQISNLCVDLMVDKADVQLLIKISSVQDLNISQLRCLEPLYFTLTLETWLSLSSQYYNFKFYLIFNKVDQSFAKEGIEPVVFLEDQIMQVAVVSLHIFQGNLDNK